MKKIWVALLVALLALPSVSLAQSNVRPMYDNTVNGGSEVQTVDPTHGLPVQVVSGGATSTIRVTSAQTVTASSAYVTGNVVGGNITFTNAVPIASGGGIIQTVVVRGKAGQAVPYDIFLFDSAPSTQTDKTAVALTTGDLAACIGTISVSGMVLGAATTNGIITSTGLGQAFKLGSGTTLYAVLVARGTPTYASTSDVSLDLVILPN